jgi:hypothetical protein
MEVPQHTYAWESPDGEVRCWVDAGASLMLKAVTKEGDPVELGPHELRALVHHLTRALAVID